MNETIVTVVGNAVDDPNYRQLDNGTSVCNFRVASTARRFDRASQRWEDGDSFFLKVTCWRQLADNVNQSLRKGDPIVVTGRIFTRSYEAEGQRRSSYELDALSLGHDLARGVSEFRRTVRVMPTHEVVGPADGRTTGEGNEPEFAEDSAEAFTEEERKAERSPSLAATG
jgi:single-strand DNA-binding protein